MPPVPVPMALGYHVYHFLFISFGKVVTFMVTYIYIYIEKLVSIHPCVPEFQTIASQGPET
jgi:hypothetical protein